MPANGVNAAFVAALPDHLEQPRRSQTRILLEALRDERQVRVEQRDTAAEPAIDESARLDRQLDGIVMNTELSGDGADLPVLGEKEPPDACALLVGDHRATSEIKSRSRSRKLPRPWMRCRRWRCAPAGTQTML